MSELEMTPGEVLRILDEAVALIERLPVEVQCEVRDAVAGERGDTVRPLADLAQRLAQGPMRIPTFEYVRGGVWLRYCRIGLDSAGWPAWLSVESEEHVRHACMRRAHYIAAQRAGVPFLLTHYCPPGRIGGGSAIEILGDLDDARGERP